MKIVKLNVHSLATFSIFSTSSFSSIILLISKIYRVCIPRNNPFDVVLPSHKPIQLWPFLCLSRRLSRDKSGHNKYRRPCDREHPGSQQQWKRIAQNFRILYPQLPLKYRGHNISQFYFFFLSRHHVHLESQQNLQSINTLINLFGKYLHEFFI